MRNIFTYASPLDAAGVFFRVIQAPEIRELALVSGMPNLKQTRWEAMDFMIENLKRYLTVTLQTKGSRTTAKQQAYQTVLAACSGPNLTGGHLRATGRLLVRYTLHFPFDIFNKLILVATFHRECTLVTLPVQ